jgi:hypothetical protein
MKLPRLNFTVRGILMATAWMAVCFGSFAVINEIHRLRVPSPYEVPLTHVMMISPLVAVGALFQRTLWGLLIGAIADVAFWFIFYSS